ncbi:uncharacterized protein FOMMEDRAFT_52738, partial [Fomitiporia mediterranea MF3/22]|uniref:uncharacterized protein n=1 Tax=Fomitiporia mediterranea (strain MF3/22) TaxID=694068 RepID=UPI0004407322
AAAIIPLTGLAIIKYANTHLIKSPMYTGKQTGEEWVQEILHGHPVRFFDSMGMSQLVFTKLKQELQMYSSFGSTKNMSMDEQLAIFIYI